MKALDLCSKCQMDIYGRDTISLNNYNKISIGVGHILLTNDSEGVGMVCDSDRCPYKFEIMVMSQKGIGG